MASISVEPEKLKGHKHIVRKLKEIDSAIKIDSAYEVPERLMYGIWLSVNSRKCKVLFSRHFLDDLEGFTGNEKSEYWQKMESQLTSKLFEQIEKHGLIPYSKRIFKKLIVEYWKKELEKKKKEEIKFHKIGFIGRRFQEGNLELSLNIKFTPEERQEAYSALENLVKQKIFVPTYSDIINLEDWYTIGKNFPFTKVEDEKENIVQQEEQNHTDIELQTHIKARNKAKYEYDVVLSFAGEDRKYAEQLAISIDRAGFKVFYDKFEESKLWGKNLYEYLSEVYAKHGRYCVMFLSKHYAKKLWTNHERKNAQERAFKDNKEYILPIKIDDTKIPGILDTVGYLDLREKCIDEIGNILINKLNTKL